MQPPFQPDTLLADPGDAELAQRAGSREEAAFRAIMGRYNARLYRIARSILRNDAEAEDVVQETYVRAFTHLHTFRGEASFGTWLTRIAMNEALGRRRRSTAREETTGLTVREEEDAPSESARSDDPERTMAQREIRRLVEAAIEGLPERYRLVLVARVIEGMSVEETAGLLAVSGEAVKVQLHRARSLLRAELERQIGPLVLDAFPFAGARCARFTEATLARLAAEPQISA
jgi:RNA polymerase sigma-70 factor (ECF subfamily)